MEKAFFWHPVNARDTPEMKRLIGKWGLAGYGIFLRLCESLAISKMDIDAVVAMLEMDNISPSREFIADCIDFGVLTIKDGYIPCPFETGGVNSGQT